MEVFSLEERQAICDTFERVLGDMADEEQLRRLADSELGFDAELWAKIAELGLTGIAIDVEHGGIGGGMEEVEALMEVAGRYLYSGPFVPACVIAPAILSSCLPDTRASELLRNIASGEEVMAVAGCDSNGDWTGTPSITAEKRDDQWLLRGSAEFVAHAKVANHCLVYSQTEAGIAAFVVDMTDAGLEVDVRISDDPTQRLASLSFDAVQGYRLLGAGPDELNEALSAAIVASAGEQVGAARRIFDITVEYMKTRHQFGQPIGRFQALKHMAADLLIELESASSAARYAAQAIASGCEDKAQATYLAGFSCADSFRKISADAIQMHGGIAYTMEHPAHLFWRRARVGQWLYCSSNGLRELYLQELEKTL